MKWRFTWGTVLLGLFVLGDALPVGATGPPAGFVDTQVVSASAATGAAGPVAVAYEPGTGHLWVLEKGAGVQSGTARVRVRDAVSAQVSTALTLDCVDSQGERGLLGIAFSPHYLDPGDQSRFVYLFYTRHLAASGDCDVAGSGEGTRIRVSRFTESGMTLSGEHVLWEGPFQTAATNHNGGTLRFAPDGTLFLSIGDNDTDHLDSPLARDLGDPRGKILRLNEDGSIPADNPFVGSPGVLPEIWAWGLRNPFRFDFDSLTAAPLIGDVGQQRWEAAYAGVPGADYGYPCVEGSAPFQDCDPTPAAGSVTSPIFEYGHGSETPPVSGNTIIGGPVYRADAFPEEYRGNFYFGDYVDDWIRRARFSPQGRLIDVEIFHDSTDAVVDIIVSPEGCLTWVGIAGEGVVETCYVGGDNEPPWAIASAAPTSGLADLPVQFTGSSSTDPDGDTLLYDWQFDDNGSSGLPDPLHSYTGDGIYHATLTVDDQQGEASSTDSAPPLRIVVGNLSPTASIDSPGPGTFYNAGDTIAFAGSATDPEDDTLTAEAFSWSIFFHHAAHAHPYQGPLAGIAGGSFTIPTSGEDSTSVFFRIHLTATDSGSSLGAAGALSDSTFVDLLPHLSQITLATTPADAGLELSVDGQAGLAPIVRASVVNSSRTVGAAEQQSSGGKTWDFLAWSDGGAAEHVIATPASDTTYTASYECDLNVLTGPPIDTVEVFEDCDAILAGAGFEVAAGGDVTLRASASVTLDNGASIAEGGKLTIEVDPEGTSGGGPSPSRRKLTQAPLDTGSETRKLRRR